MDETTKGNEMLQVTIQAGWMKQAGEKLKEQDPGRGDDVPKGVKRKRIQDTEEVRKEFRFKKKGKMNKQEIIELKKTHRSLKGWMSAKETDDPKENI